MITYTGHVHDHVSGKKKERRAIDNAPRARDKTIVKRGIARGSGGKRARATHIRAFQV